MKNLLTLFTTTLFISGAYAQSSHIVTAFDFGFSPQILTVLPGDTVFLENQGYHSMVEVSEEDWNNNLANSNGGFWIGVLAPTTDNWFVVNETGTYRYICEPHAPMGMKATIEVVDPTVGIQDGYESEEFSIQASGNGQYTLNFPKCDEFVVIKTNGQRQLSKPMQGLDGQAFFDFSELATGAYLGIFLKDGEGIRVVKFMR